MSMPPDQPRGLNSPFAQRRPRRRWLRWTLIVLAVATLAGALGAPSIRSSFRAWRARVWIETAETELRRGNLAEANTWAYKTLLRFPENREAPRLLADICESRGSLLAIRWRLVLAESTGYEREPTLALARTAVRFAQPATAMDALRKLKEGDLRTSADWVLAAEAAALASQSVQARAALECARRLEPGNERIRARIAMLDANSTDPAMRASAVGELQALGAGSSREAFFALRTLAVTDPRLVDPAVSQAAAEEIARRDSAETEDMLSALPALERSGSLLLPGLRDRLSTAAATQEAAALKIARWHFNRGRLDDAAAILATQPLGKGENLDLCMLAADVAFARQDPASLVATLSRQEWARYDLLREAILLRALELTGQALPALNARWDGVLKNLASDPDIAMAIAALADRWGRKKESLYAWKIVARSSAARLRIYALRQMFDLCLKERWTSDLLVTVRELSSEFPADHQLRNNVAYLQLVLNVNVDRAGALADDLAQAHPAEPRIVSTRALHLWRQRRLGEARRLLAEAQVRFPDASELTFVRTLVLAAEGNPAAVTLSAGLAAKRPLLPEEAALLQDALRGLVASNGRTRESGTALR